MESAKRDLKSIISEVDDLVKEGYGTYTELINLSFRETEDIRIVKLSKAQEEQLKDATK